MHDIAFTVRIFEEGETFVAYAPELDVSSFGSTGVEARKNIQDAVWGIP
jgi:predicted RNase H-like HicB family nuclease